MGLWPRPAPATGSARDPGSPGGAHRATRRIRAKASLSGPGAAKAATAPKQEASIAWLDCATGSSQPRDWPRGQRATAQARPCVPAATAAAAPWLEPWGAQKSLRARRRSRQSELNRAQKHAAPAKTRAPASARLVSSGTSLGAAHDGRAGRAPSPCPWPSTSWFWNAELLPARGGGPTTRHRRRLEQKPGVAPPTPEPPHLRPERTVSERIVVNTSTAAEECSWPMP